MGMPKTTSNLGAGSGGVGQDGLRDHEHELIAIAGGADAVDEACAASWKAQFLIRRATYHALASRCLRTIPASLESPLR